MILRPARSTRTDKLFPNTTLLRSPRRDDARRCGRAAWNPRRRPHRTVLPPERGGARPSTDRPTQLRGSPPPGRPRPHDCRCSRSEEHTSELQSLMRISYAVFCVKKKKKRKLTNYKENN